MEEYTTTGPKSKRDKKRGILARKSVLLVAAAVVIGAVGFFGGAAYQKHQSANQSMNMASGVAAVNGQGFAGGRFARRGGEFGTVTAVSSSSITVQNQRTGTSTTYAINSSTQIADNGASTTTAAIQNGDTVLVQTSGAASTTATRIEINPSFGGFGSGSAQPQSSGASAGGSLDNPGSASVN